MSKAQTEWRFNFGPIARTDAGGTHNTFNLAALPLHIMLDALMASTNCDEFVAWLWHDLFKPAFYWLKNNQDKFQWNHIPGLGLFEQAEAKFANTGATNIPMGLVRTHQFQIENLPRLGILEQDIISDQVDQINLGAASVYLQLAFAVEPAMSTALVRAVIADSFVEAVTKSVARELGKMLASKVPTFSRIRFVFETESSLRFSTPPTDSEIWSQVGQKYDIRQVGDELVIHHLIPVEIADGFKTEVAVDLTGVAPTPEQLTANTLGLAELLVVYQDDRTVLMTVPQPSIYSLDTNRLKQEILSLVRTKLNALDVLTVGDGIDLLETAFASQIVIREVPNRLPIPPNPHVTKRSPHLRPIDEVVAHPGELLSQAAIGGRHCRVCGSAFASNLPLKDNWPGHDFTDTEYIGFGNAVCPLCQIYILNNHKSRTSAEKARGVTGDRKSMRGSFALILPSSYFGVRDGDCRLVERPPLDLGGRFDLHRMPLQRVTVTQQEFALFNQISRRIIVSLWQKIEPSTVLPLPYLGGILLTHREAGQVRKVLPALRELFMPVKLLAYPFEVNVTPGVEIALDVALTDFKQHHTKHTFLKSRASVVPIHPNSRISLLADNKIQIELNRDWFEAYNYLAAFTTGMSAGQRDEWMRRVAGGSDIMTSYYESAETILRSKRKTAKTAEQTALTFTDSFGTNQFGNDPSQAWATYESKLKDIREILNRYPMLPQLFSAMTER